MKEWTEALNLEKEIILCVNRKKKSISEIANELKKSNPTISIAVNRMVENKILVRNIEYGIDARYSKVGIKKGNIKIKRIHKFYYYYFFSSFALILTSLFLSIKIISTPFFLGALLGTLPLFFYMLYYAYVTKDKITVEKLIFIQKKPKKVELASTNSDLALPTDRPI
jgi:DNA-binding Lrp family transcriptional regulator